jgi:hypothetical protein
MTTPLIPDYYQIIPGLFPDYPVEFTGYTGCILILKETPVIPGMSGKYSFQRSRGKHPKTHFRPMYLS